MKIIALLTLCVGLAGAVLTGCGSSAGVGACAGSALLGTWVGTNESLAFAADCTFTHTGTRAPCSDGGSYSESGSTLTLNYSNPNGTCGLDGEFAVAYTVNGTALTIAGNNYTKN